jgi:hypothetical protein
VVFSDRSKSEREAWDADTSNINRGAAISDGVTSLEITRGSLRQILVRGIIAGDLERGKERFKKAAQASGARDLPQVQSRQLCERH